MSGLPLQNPRWEVFCQAYVRGPAAGNATASYAAAGFAGGPGQTGRSGAFRLLHKDCVRRRIAELQEDSARAEARALSRVAGRRSLSKDIILSQLANLGFANILDYLRRSDTDDIVVDLGAVERDQAAGIVQLSVTERGEGPHRVRTMRIRLCDRRAPLIDLGRHFGLFTDKQGDGEDEVRHMSTDELRRNLMEGMEKLGYRLVPLHEQPPKVEPSQEAASPPCQRETPPECPADG